MDDLDLAAERILSHLEQSGGIAFTNTRATQLLAEDFSGLLETLEPGSHRAEVVADYLVELDSVVDLFADDEQLEQLLVQFWDGVSSGEATLASSRLQAPSSPHHEALEAAIRKNPEDRQLYAVYADWLEEQGDPLGRLIRLHLEVEQRPKQTQPRAVFGAYLRKHRNALLGDIAPYLDRVAISWRAGFIYSARIYSQQPDHNMDGARLLAELLALPIARFLEHLTLGAIRYGGAELYEAQLEVLCQKERPTLRCLRVGDWPERETIVRKAVISNVAPLPTVAPRLRELRLEAGYIQPVSLSFAELERLDLHVTGGDLLCLDALMKAELPRLQVLNLVAVAPFRPPWNDAKRFESLFAGSFPSLRKLGLRINRFGDELMRMLLDSELPEQLTLLDLCESNLTNGGARLLLDNIRRFGKLERLVLLDNDIDDELQFLEALQDKGTVTLVEVDEPYDDNME
jgi:uncharacterized protein (TIGR02996 family)